VAASSLKHEYNPHREVSIDEAMIGFSGRLGFKQYVPLKPTKRGIKVWVRADPHNGPGIHLKVTNIAIMGISTHPYFYPSLRWF
jgi:hypothetical protein